MRLVSSIALAALAAVASVALIAGDAAAALTHAAQAPVASAHAPVASEDGSDPAEDAKNPSDEFPPVEPPTEPPAAPARVSCLEASQAFQLMCQVYELVLEYYVDPVGDSALAEAAARGARRSGLSRRTDTAPPACALPAPAFEQACAAIDAVDDTEAAVWLAVREMLASLGDPHTSLLSAEEYLAYSSVLDDTVHYIGLGLRLGLLDGSSPCRRLSGACRLTISEVHPGSPAAEAGLMPDDILLELDGLEPSGPGCGLALLPRFEQDEPVAVRVERNGRAREFIVEAGPVPDAVTGHRVVDRRLGYLRLDAFTSSADELVEEALEALLDADVEALVIDLRGNGGGYLETVVNIASLFLSDSQVVTQVNARQEALVHVASGHGSAPDPAVLPMILAVDGSSASASEVLALALRDHGRAAVAGTTTYGKNSGQITQVLTSDDGALLGAVRLTSLRWLGPRSGSAAGGITPDIAVDLSACFHPTGLVRQLAAAARLEGSIPADIGAGAADGRVQSGAASERFEAFRALWRRGLFDGTECEPGLLCPYAPVSRWEMAVWLVRFLEGSDPPPAPTLDDAGFSDVEPGRWWVPYLERLAVLGITKGCSSRPVRFCPEAPVTRGQLAVFLARALELEQRQQSAGADAPTGFADLEGSPAAEDIAALFASGITVGCSTEPMLFCPDRLISRSQLAVLLHRASRLDPGVRHTARSAPSS